MSLGYIYILSNPSMKGLLKIGYTCSNVEKRVRELSVSTGVPTAFVVEHFQLTTDVQEIESKAHERLSAYRVNENREFFNITVPIAVEEINKITKKPALSFLRVEHTCICRRCGFEHLKSNDFNLCPKCGF